LIKNGLKFNKKWLKLNNKGFAFNKKCLGALTQSFKLITVSDEGSLESTKVVIIPDAFTEIISLEEGIKAHKSKDMKKAGMK
jgi:hypothetical protein